MFDPPKELLEPYFFDFDGDLYGRMVEVELIAFLRDEEAFEDLEAQSRRWAERIEVALISFIREEMIFDGMEALAGQIAADAGEAKRRLAG